MLFLYISIGLVSSIVPGASEEFSGSLGMFQDHQALISCCSGAKIVSADRWLPRFCSSDSNFSVCQWSSPLLPPSLPPVLLAPLPIPSP